MLHTRVRSACKFSFSKIFELGIAGRSVSFYDLKTVSQTKLYFYSILY